MSPKTPAFRRPCHTAPVCLVLLALAASARGGLACGALPIVANTWAFTNATDRAWTVLNQASGDTGAALAAVEQVPWHNCCPHTCMALHR